MDLQSKPLLDLLGLRKEVFNDKVSPRWIRTQTKRRMIPFYRIGRLVRFDAQLVRDALTKNYLVQSRNEKGNR